MESDTSSPEVNLDTWAIIELFGHARVVGRISNVSIAGCGFIRVQVPAHGGLPAYTRDIAPKAVYAINPCDEEAALAAMHYASQSPVVVLASDAIADHIREKMKTHEAHQLGYHDDQEGEGDE